MTTPVKHPISANRRQKKAAAARKRRRIKKMEAVSGVSAPFASVLERPAFRLWLDYRETCRAYAARKLQTAAC